MSHDRKWAVFLHCERQPVKTMDDMRDFEVEVMARTALQAMTEAIKRAKFMDVGNWTIQGIEVRLKQDA